MRGSSSISSPTLATRILLPANDTFRDAFVILCRKEVDRDFATPFFIGSDNRDLRRQEFTKSTLFVNYVVLCPTWAVFCLGFGL